MSQKPNTGKKLIIAGAGMAGLTAAIYARRSGLDVTLIEQHNRVGGTCNSWDRKGYHFEGAIHWLTGSNPKTETYQIWKEIGALKDDTPVTYHDPFFSVEWEGQLLHLYRDADKTAEHLAAIFPDKERLIRQLAKDVKTLSLVQVPTSDVKGLKTENPKKSSVGERLKLLPALPALNKLSKISNGEYSERFAHPGIQRLLGIVPVEYSAAGMLFTLATLHKGDGGYPEGGSSALVERIAKTYKDLGGTLMLNTKVEKVNIEADRATGVILENEILQADAVIVAQETIAAMDKLFDTPPQDAWLRDLRKTVQPQTCTFIGIGIKAELPDYLLPQWQLEEPITFVDRTINDIYFYSYPQYAPEGSTALATYLLGDTYDSWKQAAAEGRYEEEKQSLADQVSRELYKKYPQCEGQIEVIDIATPLTYERYTGAYHGSWMSIMGPSSTVVPHPGYCENIQGLYFAGHRMMAPGGLPVAAGSGRTAAQLVCRQFDVVFR